MSQMEEIMGILDIDFTQTWDQRMFAEKNITQILLNIKSGEIKEDDNGLKKTKCILELLKSIPHRESEVIKYIYFKDHTFEEVGKIYKVTRERIRQIKCKAIRRLCHPSRTKNLKKYFIDLDKLNEIKTLKENIDSLTDEERHDLFNQYCQGCGSKDKECTCWRDD